MSRSVPISPIESRPLLALGRRAASGRAFGELLP